MRLTQAGTSVPATCVVTANAVAFGNPTVTGFGALLAQQLHTPSSGAVSQSVSATSLTASMPLTAASLLQPPAKTDSARFPRSDAFSDFRGLEKQQPLHQVFTVRVDMTLVLALSTFFTILIFVLKCRSPLLVVSKISK